MTLMKPPKQSVAGYALEQEIAGARSLLIAGVDEVGRGAWAGPVIVCAAIARAGFPEPPGGLTDSKRLTAKRRAELAAELPGWVEAYAIGSASHEEIDALGMTAALRLAARTALGNSPSGPTSSCLTAGTTTSARPGRSARRSRPTCARSRWRPPPCWPRCTGTR